VIWAVPIEGKPWFAGGGLLYKVILPMMVSPLLGFLLGAVLMAGLYFLFRNRRPWPVNARFARLQILSSAAMGFSHGSNDAQKTMGIITLGLFSATTAGTLDHLPASLHFLRTPAFEVALWVKLVCAVTMAAGTATGGRRIIKTLGRKVSRLQPVNGFASDLTSATIILIAAKMGMPVSTTHIASSSIMGVGFARRSKGMRWDVVESILWAWFLTLPASGLAGYLLMTIMGGK
jgi:PiT family inorganic phosphate transporter